jgi:Rieske 2Fe-2S family protein
MYTSREHFEREMDRIFASRWICAGRSDSLAHAGDFRVIEVANESIILLRDAGGDARAYFNVCRHRGTRLCEAAAGSFDETIQCPYHAWTYSLDGRLIGAPHMAGLAEFRKSDYPLHAVAVQEWEGFLFVNLAEEPQPFAEAYASLIGRFSRFNLGALEVGRRIEYDVAANWKLIHQNYSECYHCSPVHPALVRITPSSSGENDLFDGPFLGGYMVITEPGGSLTMSGRACGVAVGDLPEKDLQRVWYYSIFPNVLLSLHPDYVMAHTLWPAAPNRTRIVCEWLFHPETLRRPEFDIDDGVAFWDMTNKQDWHVCELSQLGVSSRAYTPGPYSPRESLAVAFDREVLRSLGEAER